MVQTKWRLWTFPNRDLCFSYRVTVGSHFTSEVEKVIGKAAYLSVAGNKSHAQNALKRIRLNWMLSEVREHIRECEEHRI